MEERQFHSLSKAGLNVIAVDDLDGGFPIQERHPQSDPGAIKSLDNDVSQH